MILRKFIVGVIIRFVLLFALLVALAAIITDWNYIFSQLTLLVILLLLLWEFFRYITKTNRDLSKFIYAIQYQDFSVNFSSHRLGSAFDELHDSFRQLMEMYRSNKLEKEEQFQLLQNLVDRMPVGLLVCTDNGEVVLTNQHVHQLTETKSFPHIDGLERTVPGLSNQLKALMTEQPELLTIQGKEVHAQRSRFKTNQPLDVWLFQTTRDSSDDREMDAWLKLIRILTHEIMNSVTSVSSLSETALGLAQKENKNPDLQQALQTIHQRSQGMLQFVADYRKLTNVPAPRKSWFDLSELVKEQLGAAMMSARLRDGQAVEALTLHNVHADREQIAQVILNVLLNAKHAMENSDRKEIEVDITKEGRKTTLSITDSGHGISPEELSQIFIPFYSTREDGSGIGLSLCRQIMRNHGGSISAVSDSDKGTTFRLSFLDGG